MGVAMDSDAGKCPEEPKNTMQSVAPYILGTFRPNSLNACIWALVGVRIRVKVGVGAAAARRNVVEICALLSAL